MAIYPEREYKVQLSYFVVVSPEKSMGGGGFMYEAA